MESTLAILENSLIGGTKWVFLTRELGKTYNSDKFVDLAIDHIAVPDTKKELFTQAQKTTDTFGSDHFPIWTEFSPGEN